MCQCTYCKGVYVGLLCLRVIYLPKDHDVTSENFRWNICKICSILFVTMEVINAMDQHGTVFVFISEIYLFQSQPGRTTMTTAAQSTTIQATGMSQSEITHITCSWVSHFMETICIQATVDLCCLFTTVNCWAFYTTYCTYFSNRSILQTIWWLETVFSVSRCMKKKQL